MDQKQISSMDLLEMTHQTRLRKDQEIEPELIRFRALPEEADIQVAEDKAEAKEIEELKTANREMSEVLRLAQSLARSGREGVRFERWLEQDAKLSATDSIPNLRGVK